MIYLKLGSVACQRATVTGVVFKANPSVISFWDKALSIPELVEEGQGHFRVFIG